MKTETMKKKKLIWLNAYNYDDLIPINNFLNFYFNEVSYKIDDISTYEFEVSKIYEDTPTKTK